MDVDQKFYDSLKRFHPGGELNESNDVQRPAKIPRLAASNLVIHVSGICDPIIKEDGTIDTYYCWAWIAMEVSLDQLNPRSKLSSLF